MCSSEVQTLTYATDATGASVTDGARVVWMVVGCHKLWTCARLRDALNRFSTYQVWRDILAPVLRLGQIPWRIKISWKNSFRPLGCILEALDLSD